MSLQEMRDEDAARIAEVIADDLIFLRDTLDHALETIMMGEDCPERAGMIATNRAARDALDLLPKKIAGHGPFTSRDACLAASRIEVMHVLDVLSGDAMPTCGSA